jgi:hypothetical protein
VSDGGNNLRVADVEHRFVFSPTLVALSAFLFTVAAISSIAAEVSSRLTDWSSVRCERSVELIEIAAAAFVTS